MAIAMGPVKENSTTGFRKILGGQEVNNVVLMFRRGRARSESYVNNFYCMPKYRTNDCKEKTMMKRKKNYGATVSIPEYYKSLS